MAPRGKEISLDIRKLVIKYHRDINSVRQIGKSVEKVHSVENKCHFGRPALLTGFESRFIVRKIQ